MEFARRHGAADPVRIRAVSTVTPRYPNTVLDLPDIATDSAAAVAPPDETFRASIARAAYEEAGFGPEDLSLAEVYDLSTALELQWYEDLGLCGEGEGAKLLREGATAPGGRIPVNASGGLASFGEAVPAQAIAQVCELTWQLRGDAGERQVPGARVGLTAKPGAVRARVGGARRAVSDGVSRTPCDRPARLRERLMNWPWAYAGDVIMLPCAPRRILSASPSSRWSI